MFAKGAEPHEIRQTKETTAAATKAKSKATRAEWWAAVRETTEIPKEIRFKNWAHVMGVISFTRGEF